MAPKAIQSKQGDLVKNIPAPRLGMVIRMNPDACLGAVKDMEKAGFRVASSRDFKAAASVPNDFGGADVQYFERFGIAIVRGDSDRLKPMLAKSAESKTVKGIRAERMYRALGAETQEEPRSRRGVDFHDYLVGYRDGVNRVIDDLLREGGAKESPLTAAKFDESTITWGLEAINIRQTELSGVGIKVAVLDTGFDENHPDFRGRSVTKKLFASQSSDGDTHGHGTHCIGVSCGPLQPSHGPRYGIAHEAEIYAGKVLGDDGFGTDRSIIAGMEWALEQGCEIISMSLGAVTKVGDTPNGDYERIGQVCLDAGTLIVAAAGNESDRPGSIAPVGSPANASTIMAVAALDRSFTPARFSCGGLNPGQDIDIAAPGVDILSSLPGGKYARWSGTSMATPHVSGVAALIAQSDKKFRGGALWARLLQLTKRLEYPARDVGKGFLQVPGRADIT